MQGCDASSWEVVDLELAGQPWLLQACWIPHNIDETLFMHKLQHNVLIVHLQYTLEARLVFCGQHPVDAADYGQLQSMSSIMTLIHLIVRN